MCGWALPLARFPRGAQQLVLRCSTLPRVRCVAILVVHSLLTFIFVPVVAFLNAVVSDAGRGGQVLMCSRTFLAVKDLGRELGCVTQDGPKLVKPEHPFWFR